MATYVWKLSFHRELVIFRNLRKLDEETSISHFRKIIVNMRRRQILTINLRELDGLCS